jgi:isopentenyl diphosphate isomerase/L-lactate dehydrogenase-like FMN-dependent dehydrogenase
MFMDFVTNQEIILAARRKLGQAAWDYLVGGSESETTMRRNRLAYDRVAFRPRVLVDVSKIDTSSTFLGHTLRIPVLLAPMGTMQVFDAGGGATAGEAAAEFGTMQVVSSATEPSLEEGAVAGSGPKVYQLYVRDNLAAVADVVRRAKDAGYVGFCITVDLAVYSRRERPLLGRSTAQRDRATLGQNFLARLDLNVADRIKEMTDAAGLPFIVKGIATAEDAALALEHGVDVIWVSNHGGRQLDHGRGSLEVLPEIVEAVAGRATIVVDGGIQRGGDILKALAMGAQAVAIGKLQGWGLGAAGKDGLVRVLEILEDEMISSMGLLGVTAIDQLNGSYLRKAEPVTLPHEMSAWVNMPGTRIQ